MSQGDGKHAERDDTAMEWLLRMIGTVCVYKGEKPSQKLRLSESKRVLEELEDGSEQERASKSLKYS